MKIDAPNLNHLWAQLMVEELIRNGVAHFFVAPGSRSSPLALAVASRVAGATASSRRGKPRGGTPSLHVHFDERGLAFAALGCARATGIPAVVITTSGTAVANLFPAVIEASMDHVPMILLTGDRPPELRDCGANQAIDQLKIFGTYARWFFDLPCPDEKISPRFVLTTIDQAFARAAVGPVHLNCQFREPLAPREQAYDRDGLRKELSSWIQGNRPFTAYECSSDTLTLGCKLGEDGKRRKTKGLLVVSGLRDRNDARPVLELAANIGWPVLADVRSYLRTDIEKMWADSEMPLAKGAGTHVIARTDHLLLSQAFAESHRPAMVIQFGGRLLSKRLQEWLSTSKPQIFSLVAEGRSNLDPSGIVTHRWDSGIDHACKVLQHRLAKTGSPTWLKSWQRADAAADKAMTVALKTHPLSEPWLAAAVTELLPSDHGLFLASSMPVRDADMYGRRMSVESDVGANRGASGIDGTVASAFGASVCGMKAASVIIGDLALLHDLNSLALVRGTKKPFVIVVINNDGGAIFSFLPVAQYPLHFEQVFGTPHGLGFAKAAELFGLTYENPTTAAGFEAAYREACGRHGATLIEVRTNREENLRIHREIQDAVRKAVDKIS